MGCNERLLPSAWTGGHGRRSDAILRLVARGHRETLGAVIRGGVLPVRLWVTSVESTTLHNSWSNNTTGRLDSLLGYVSPLSLWAMKNSTRDIADEPRLRQGRVPEANAPFELDSQQCRTEWSVVA